MTSLVAWKGKKIVAAPGSAELCGNNRKRDAGRAAVRTRRDCLLPRPAPAFLPSVSVHCICVNSIPLAPLTQRRHLDVINPQATAATTHRWPDLPFQHSLINPPPWRRWRPTPVGVTRPRGRLLLKCASRRSFSALRAAGGLFFFPRPQNDLSAARKQTFDKYYAPVLHSNGRCVICSSSKKKRSASVQQVRGLLNEVAAARSWPLPPAPPFFSLTCSFLHFFSPSYPLLTFTFLNPAVSQRRRLLDLRAAAEDIFEEIAPHGDAWRSCAGP